ncbi:MAG: hypothetical protein R3B48_06800 [Kofleriaceae bacterium]
MRTTEQSQVSPAEVDAPVRAIAPGKQTRAETAAGARGQEGVASGWGTDETAHQRAGSWEADDDFLSAVGLGSMSVAAKADAAPLGGRDVAPGASAAVAPAAPAAARPAAKKPARVKHPDVYLTLGDARYSIVAGVLRSGKEELGEIEDAQAAVGKLGKRAPGAIVFRPSEGVTAPAAGDLVAAAPEGSTITSGRTSWVKHGGSWDKLSGHKKRGGGKFKGFSKYGGGSVRERLTELARAGQVRLSGEQVAVIAAMAEVETGGQIACVQTYDDQVMSIGFKQVVLGHGSLEKIIEKAPAGFAKHGIVLDHSRTYVKDGWSKQPHQVAGCEDVEELRTPAWAIKFYYASMEPDVVAAIAELALSDLREVERTIEASEGDAGHDFFNDVVSKAWLLEVYNNRPAFTAKATALAAGKPAANREAFLDVLAESIIETYKVEEPLLAYRKAKRSYKKKHGGKDLPSEADAELLVKMKEEYTPIGERKGTNIVTKIPRTLTAAHVGAAAASSGGAASAGASSGAPPAARVTSGPPRTAPKAGGAPTTAAAGRGLGRASKAGSPTPTTDEGDSFGFDDLLLGMLSTVSKAPAVIAAGVSQLAGAGHAGPASGPKGADATGPAQAAPRAAPAPLPVSVLGDASLEQLVAKIGSAEVTAIAGQLAALKVESQGLKRNRQEEQGEGRDDLVEHLGALRARLEALPKGDANGVAFKAKVYRAMQDLAPYYFQSRNIDILEAPPADKTRTCNLTCLGMALESLGRSAANFKGHKDSLMAAARFYQHKIVGDAKSEAAHDATAGRGTSWDELANLRLPDFLELAAIARNMKGATDDDAVKAGAKSAWDDILKWGFLQDLASDFSVKAKIKMFDASGIKDSRKAGTKADHRRLRGLGDKNRKAVEKFLNARNTAAAKGSKQNLAAVEKLRPAYDAAIRDDGIDDQVSLTAYRDHLMKEVGSDLDSGKAVIVGLASHFVKLQALDEDHVIVDDPARDSRASSTLSYAEARAMGYFHMRFVLS